MLLKKLLDFKLSATKFWVATCCSDFHQSCDGLRSNACSTNSLSNNPNEYCRVALVATTAFKDRIFNRKISKFKCTLLICESNDFTQPKSYKNKIITHKEDKIKEMEYSIAGLHSSLNLPSMIITMIIAPFIKYQNAQVKNSMALLPSEILTRVQQQKKWIKWC